MKHPKQIPSPILKSAVALSPLDLNNCKLNPRHTILTPELLEQIAAAGDKSK